MRCQDCLQITLADIRGGEILQKCSFPALKSSAESGCDLCALIFAAIYRSSNGIIKRPNGDEVNIIDALCQGQNPTRNDSEDTRVYMEGGAISDFQEVHKYNEKRDRVLVRVGGDVLGDNSIEAYLDLGVDPESAITKYIPGRVPSQSPDDLATISRIKDWIKTCDQKHKTCANLFADRPQPKRILDISGDKPIVLETNFAEGRYVALSYCWGPSGKNVLLTSAAFEEFTSTGIDVNTLPKTIRDAILVCKALAIDRLWVDALCIIQREPDLKDFIAEAPRMVEYYNNAYLTLIAGSAEDCADGFLNKRSNPRAAPCEITYDRTIFPTDTDMTGSVELFMHPSQDVGPIRHRAWTFQESNLTQRSITYGIDQVRFICPSISAFEDGDFQNTHSALKGQTCDPSGFPGIHHIIRQKKEAEVLESAYQLWFGTLFEYTSRNLTNPQDKLAAIAGFARLVQEKVQCRYMYGLWEDRLLNGLLWKTWSHAGYMRKVMCATRSVQRAPSWSWASMNGGPIFHMYSAGTSSAKTREPGFFRLEIVSCDNVCNALDPIRAAVNVPEAFELKVRGLLRRVWYLRGRSDNFPQSMLFDSQAVENAQPQDDITREPSATGLSDTREDFEKRVDREQQLYALLVTSDTGLLLAQVDGKRYRRVGHFRKPKEELFNNTELEEIVLI